MTSSHHTLYALDDTRATMDGINILEMFNNPKIKCFMLSCPWKNLVKELIKKNQ